jgi:hypothetical protein
MDEVMPIPQRARLIVVSDQRSLEDANLMFLDIKALRKKIADTFDPIIAAAHKAHSEAIAQRKLVEEPLIVAERWLNGQVTDYKREQDRIRAEEEERLRQEAIKAVAFQRLQEETERLAEAAALEAAGAKEEAEALVAEAIEEREKPIEAYVPPPAAPKVELEGAAVKTYWRAEVTDLKALCRAIVEGTCPVSYVEPNMTVLNMQARALKKEMVIPGVRAVSATSMAATGRK